MCSSDKLNFFFVFFIMLQSKKRRKLLSFTYDNIHNKVLHYRAKIYVCICGLRDVWFESFLYKSLLWTVKICLAAAETRTKMSLESPTLVRPKILAGFLVLVLKLILNLVSWCFLFGFIFNLNSILNILNKIPCVFSRYFY